MAATTHESDNCERDNNKCAPPTTTKTNTTKTMTNNIELAPRGNGASSGGNRRRKAQRRELERRRQQAAVAGSGGRGAAAGRHIVASNERRDEQIDDDEDDDDDDDDERQNDEAARPLIKLQDTLAGSSASLRRLSSGPASMVQVELESGCGGDDGDDGESAPLAGPKLGWPSEERSAQTSGSAASGRSSASSSASSVLESSRRSSSVYAVDMRALVYAAGERHQDRLTCDTQQQRQQQQQQQKLGQSYANLVRLPKLEENANREQQEKRLLRSSSTSNCFKEPTSAAEDSMAARGGGGSSECVAFRPGQARRTISRSMLEFDPAVRENERFQLYWRHLTFAYAPSWSSRLAERFREQTAPGARPASNVLEDLSGSIRSNQLVAVMGPSGCGKTTLLQFLAANNGGLPRPSRGELRLSGLSELKVAYIGQDDDLLPGLTARETLIYASRLQNNATHFDHAAHVQPILSELGLLECAERSVAKLSGGQAKRVTIAQELLYPTNLLILDEVTSGLDASTSYAIVTLLKYLVSDARYPMSIVMSIHQPSARLFSVFDRVYVMSAGCCLYEGASNLSQINKHLGRFALECPKFHNMADYLIELACCPTSDSSAGDLDAAELVDQETCLMGGKAPPDSQRGMDAIRRQMVEYQREQSDVLPIFRESHKQDDLSDLMMIKEKQTMLESDCDFQLAVKRARRRRLKPFWRHLALHFSRSMLRIRRSYILTWLQLITYIILGLQLATFYGPDVGQRSGCPRLPANLISFILTPPPPTSNGGGDSNNEAEDEPSLELRRIQENMNFLLVAVMTATFAALEITVITFPLEAKTVKREWRNGWYRTSSYFAGRTLADLPFQLAFVLTFSLLIYTLTGQIGLTSWRFASFLLILIMTASVAQSFGLMFGALFMNNLPAAVFTAPLAIFPTLLFSGFFSRVSQVPAFYRPLTYLSHFRYAFDALLVTLYGFQRCACDQDALDHYHASVHNQTSTMRDLFQLLFGASDCLTAAAGGGAEQDEEALKPTATSTQVPPPVANLLDTGDAGGVSREDLAAIRAGNATLASQLAEMIRTTTSAPLATAASGSASASLKQLEDLLVESAFQQMAASSRASESGGQHLQGAVATNDTLIELSPMDRLAEQFSTRLTGMLSKQANFGHPMPRQCAQFNSYLLTEFNLADDDLWFGLAMLLVTVLVTRLLCNFTLHLTVASRAK